MKIRPSTRKTFDDLTETERMKMEEQIAKSINYWEDELYKRFEDGVFFQIAQGKTIQSRDVKKAKSSFDAALEYFSHWCLMEKEWKYLSSVFRGFNMTIKTIKDGHEHKKSCYVKTKGGRVAAINMMKKQNGWNWNVVSWN